MQTDSPPRHEPVDLADSTWSSATDWAVGAVLAFVAMTVWAVGVSAFFGPVPVGLGTVFAYQRWRAIRLTKGLHRLDTAFVDGTVLVRVSEHSGSMFKFVGSGQPCVLSIADGRVALSATSTRPMQTWPASRVQLGPSSSWWAQRGVMLETPDGRRYLSVLAKGDAAVYWSTWIDRRALPAISAALWAQQQAARATATAPGWFSDPAGAPVLRWWDGSAWTHHTH